MRSLESTTRLIFARLPSSIQTFAPFEFPLPHRFPVKLQAAPGDAGGMWAAKTFLRAAPFQHPFRRLPCCGQPVVIQCDDHPPPSELGGKTGIMRQQNIALQETVRKQATEIESLSRRIATVETTAAPRENRARSPCHRGTEISPRWHPVRAGESQWRRRDRRF